LTKYVDTIRSNNSSLYTAKLKGKLEGEALGEAHGLKKGKLEGKAEGILQVAKKMKAKGVSVDVISEVTGLSKKDVVKLNV
jgi:predicted transposase/invertase (TIGR01784 family)